MKTVIRWKNRSTIKAFFNSKMKRIITPQIAKFVIANSANKFTKTEGASVRRIIAKVPENFGV